MGLNFIICVCWVERQRICRPLYKVLSSNITNRGNNIEIFTLYLDF